MRRRSRACLWLSCLLGWLWAAQATASTLVLIGEMDAESDVFKSIIKGLSDASDEALVRIVEPTALASMLELAAGQTTGVVVLGRTLIDQMPSVRTEFPVLLGGFTGALEDPTRYPGISLNIDPAFVIRQINNTGADIIEVLTSVSASTASGDEIRALDALESIQSDIAVAEDERSSARTWFEIARIARADKDAVLIADDQFLDVSGAYRYLLEAAWRKKVLVVSSIPSFARRGVAVGFIPVLPAYGALLAETLERLRADPAYLPDGLLDGRVVRRVFNVRTLEHIGRQLPTDLDQLEHGDIVIE